VAPMAQILDRSQSLASPLRASAQLRLPVYGSGDEEAYCAMKDEEVAVICRGCHYFWYVNGLKPGDPELTCLCGKWKQPQYEVCKGCWLASEEMKAE
jgi:hypothetical protein